MTRPFCLALIGLLICGPAAAQVTAPPIAQSPPAQSLIERVDGVWIEGPGFDITYGGDYQGCAQRCQGNPKCVMIEYYVPEKKCNLYDSKKPRIKGGDSIVGIRKAN